MKEFDRIKGAQQLVDIFGYWPSFHDAEVLWIRLDRQWRNEASPARLEALVHAFEMTPEVNAKGYYVLRHHLQVHLRFDGVEELKLEGFNHQNALMELRLTDVRDRQIEGVNWQVEFESAWGVGADFLCSAIEVVRVTPCDPGGLVAGRNSE